MRLRDAGFLRKSTALHRLSTAHLEIIAAPS